MPASPAQIAASRANAKRSTGPRTEAGKARSRANGIVHGLTGEGVALSIEDAAEVDRRYQALGDELRPVGERERILARRAAFLSVRLDRCARYEVAALEEATRSAEADFDDRRQEEVEQCASRLADEPAASVRRLRRLPEGVGWMVETWSDLKRDLLAGLFGFPHLTLAENLLGRKTDDTCTSAPSALTSAMYGDFRLIDPPTTPPMTDPDAIQARKDAARADLIALIDAEIQRLQAHRSTLSPDLIARSRAEAPLRRLFDPSKEAVLFRRYETAAARELHKALALFPPVEDEPEPQLTLQEDEACEAMGSVGNSPDGEPSVSPLPPGGGPGVRTRHRR